MKHKPLIVIASIALSCSNGNLDQTSKVHSMQNEQLSEPIGQSTTKGRVDFSLETFTTIPDEIDGCASYFYSSKHDQQSEKYLLVNDFANIAFITINGNLERFELKNYQADSNIYRYSNLGYDLKLEITKKGDGGNETSILEGILILSKGKELIRKEFIGTCGC